MNIEYADPDYPTAQYLSIYEQMLRDSNSTWDGRKETLPSVHMLQERDIEYPGYEELCRGETTMVRVLSVFSRQSL